MKPHKNILTWLLALTFFTAAAAYAAAPQKINYQGYYRESGVPYSGTRTMSFKLTDAAGAANYWNSGNLSVAVSTGIFHVALEPVAVDWGNITPYLEVTINSQTLSPREAITSVAYALYASSAQTVIDGAITDAKLATGISASKLAGTIGNARLDNSSVTLQGNDFNGNSQLVQLTALGKLPAVDGSLLTNMSGISATDSTKVAKTGDTMTGQLTLSNSSTFTVTGGAFSVGGSILAVADGNVGIGAASPATKLTVSSNVAGLAAPRTGTMAHIGNADGTPTLFNLDSVAAANGIDFRRADGTAGSRTAMLVDELIGSLGAIGYGATQYSGAPRSSIRQVAAENWTDSAQGTYMSFWTTPKLSATTAEVMRVDSTGYVGIGTTNPGAKLEVNGQVKITGGNPAAGKVLTSNAVGLASWETASGDASLAADQTFTGFNTFKNVALSNDADRSIAVQEVPTNIAGKKLTISAGNGHGTYPGDNAASGGDLVLQAGRGYVNDYAGVHGGDLYLRSGTNGLAAYPGYANGGDLIFQTGGATNSFVERMRITDSGKIGIGTANPAEKLEVSNGNIKTNYGVIAATLTLTNGAGAGKVLTSDGSGNASWAAASGGGDASLAADQTFTGTNVFGKVRINTTQSVNGAMLVINNDSGNPQMYPNIEFRNADERAGYIYAIADGLNITDKRITLQTIQASGGWLDTLSLKNGRVGIRTANPSETLEVSNGNIKTNYGVIAATLTLTNGAGAGKVLTSDGAGAASWQTPAAGGDATLSTVQTFSAAKTFSAVTNMGDIVFSTSADRSLTVQTSPNHVDGKSLTIKAGDGDTLSTYAQRGGDLILQAGRGYVNDYAGVHGGNLYLRSGTNALAAYPGYANGGDLIFQTGGATNSFVERMRITDSGKIGIGTANPAEKLEVSNGNIKTNYGIIAATITLTSGAGAGKVLTSDAAGNASWAAAAGGGLSGYERVTSASGLSPRTATCPAGKKVVGGGCKSTDVNMYYIASYPDTDTSYTCVDYNSGISFQAFAICVTAN